MSGRGLSKSGRSPGHSGSTPRYVWGTRAGLAKRRPSVKRALPSVGLPARASSTLLPGSFPSSPASYFVCAAAELSSPASVYLIYPPQPSLQCRCHHGATGAWVETPAQRKGQPSGDVSALHTSGPSRGPVSQDDASPRPPSKPTLLPGPGPPALL